MSLHYNEINSYLFVNGVETITFKTKDSDIIPKVSCLGNVAKDILASNKKKQDYMELFMILVLIIVLSQLMIY